jgi:hypothetical protein
VLDLTNLIIIILQCLIPLIFIVFIIFLSYVLGIYLIWIFEGIKFTIWDYPYKKIKKKIKISWIKLGGKDNKRKSL